MTNKSPRSQSGKRPRLKLLDLNFSKNVNEVLSNGVRPHGGLRGSKKHPLSPYSFNKDEKHHDHVKEVIEKQLDDEFIDRYGSPAWVVEANREICHSGENPLFINRLLSPCRLDSDSSFLGSRAVTPTPSGRLSGTAKRTNSLYYRQATPHQYLSATELPVLSSTDPTPILGRPTRTTLLRARQRCNSAPINAYQKRRETEVKAPTGNQQPLSREPSTLCLSPEGETNHAFLTGARYNRARLMDVKSFHLYGVYMPRGNPLECFMSGPAIKRMKDRNGESPGAPPDSPRSDVEESTNTDIKGIKQNRPSTAPPKRLLSTSTPSGGRPRSARFDSSTSVNYIDESENKENLNGINNNLVENLIYLQSGLFITGKGVLVTLKGFRSQTNQKKEPVLPSVTGVSVPKIKYSKRSRNTPDDLSVINQPPPTPVGQLSIKDENEPLLPPPEAPKTPIPEESSEREDQSAETEQRQTTEIDAQPTNTEMSVKIIQLTSETNEKVSYDQTDKQETLQSNDEKNINESKVPTEKTQNTFIVVPKTDSIDDNKGGDISKNNTFITEEKQDTIDAKHVLTIPNAKMSVDSN